MNRFGDRQPVVLKACAIRECGQARGHQAGDALPSGARFFSTRLNRGRQQLVGDHHCPGHRAGAGGIQQDGQPRKRRADQLGIAMATRIDNLACGPASVDGNPRDGIGRVKPREFAAMLTLEPGVVS